MKQLKISLFVVLMLFVAIVAFAADNTSSTNSSSDQCTLNCGCGCSGSGPVAPPVAVEPLATTTPEEKPKELHKWIMLGGSGCSWCAKQKPVLAQAKELYKGQINFEILDYNQNTALAQKYGMSGGIPMNIFVDPTGKKIFGFNGYKSLEEIKQMLDKYGFKPNK